MLRIPLFLLAFTFSLNPSFAQFKYDKMAALKYDSVYKVSKLTQKTGNDIAIFTEYIVDTLNKNDYSSDGLNGIILEDINPKTGKIKKSAPRKYNKHKDDAILFCEGFLTGDTLDIQISDLWDHEMILNSFSKGNVYSKYGLHQKYDSIYKIKPEDSLSNSLVVPVKTLQFNLSDTIFKLGKVIYGNAEILMEPYYLKDSEFEDRLYIVRKKLKYYFKCRLVSDQRL
jgi:hypothetical protein